MSAQTIKLWHWPIVWLCSSEQAEAQRLKSKQARIRRAERKAQKKQELLALLAKEDEQRK